MTTDRPTVSVSVGLTVSPKPYESIRVDLEYQGVYVDGSNLEEVIDSGRPIVERLFANLLGQVEQQVAVVKEEHYGGGSAGIGQLVPDPDTPSAPPPRPDGRRML